MARDTLRPRLREAGIQRHGLLVEAERLAQAGRIVAGQAVRRLLALEEGVVGGEILRGLLREPLLLARRRARTPSACATFVAISDCTWKTSVSDASNGCCHFEVGAPDCLISTSSGLTCTRFAPPPFCQRTVAVSR